MSDPSLAADLGSLPAEAHQPRTFEFPKLREKVVVKCCIICCIPYFKMFAYCIISFFG